MFARAARRHAENQEDRDNFHRLVYWGVKIFSRGTLDGLDFDELQLRFQTICTIKRLVGQLTPAELLQIFPPEKTYDGCRYQCKDYFSTMEALRRHGMDKPIGEAATSLLWDYMNPDICEFEVGCLSTMSAIRRAEGYKGLIEEFFEEQGKPLTVYYEAKDSKGRKYMIDGNTGRRQRVYRKMPRYLRPVSG
jgi:hypothetical protein